MRSMLIRDHMSRDLVVLEPDMSILHAAHLLIENNIAGAPVLDEHGRLVGILTERDCMRVALQAHYHGTPGDLVSDRMTADPEHVSPEDSILDLLKRFIDGRHHRYPVVDGGRVVGMISRRDVMRALGEHYPNNKAARG